MEVDLRERLRALMESDKKITQARVAKESGLSPTVVSQWLAGAYPGDVEKVERTLQTWLDTTAAQRAAQDALPKAPDYVPTPSAEKALAALRYAQVAGDIAIIYGGAGVGKTSAIKRYRGSAPNVWVATMTPASASVVTALDVIAEALGLGGSALGTGAAKLHAAIVKRVAETQGLIVVDEAQHLSTMALDQIRSIHDATEIGIALVGNEQVYARMTGGNRAPFLDRLFSRIGKKVRLIRSTEGDIQKLLEAWDITDKGCRAQLVEIGTRPGALRILTKVLRLASMYAAARQQPLCCDDVRAAWRELGGAE